MAARRRQLMLPPAAESDDGAIEMLRAWIAEGGLHCVLNVGHWHKESKIDERHAWGIMLADVARHVSNALHDVAGMDQRESLKNIVESFIAEIRDQTSDHRGEWPTMKDPAREFWKDNAS
ncbi:MAG: DUF5076 domain-containing protein [Planctomycetales bacterium]|nr:DUF5076 domain-containing protein [Planctomycetales bacterium]